MGPKHVRAVVFDVGNTLWFEARTPDPAQTFAIGAAAVAPLVERWHLPLREPLADVLRDIWSAYEEGWRVEWDRGTYREPSPPFLIRGALATRGIEITEEQAVEWWRAGWILEREFGVQLYPDVLDVLRELKDIGVLVGINTNRPCTYDMHEPGLADFGIAEYVDAIVCSGDTGYIKPHPSTFELILERLGVAPWDAAMVGDTCEADMAGAKAVGMRTVWKLNGRYELDPCPHADYTIHDLAELLSLPIIPRAPRPLVTIESLTPHEDGNAERY
jgi:HAD superfamily hydrolase (TIGR01549 family)